VTKALSLAATSAGLAAGAETVTVDVPIDLKLSSTPGSPSLATFVCEL
jgi:hypothetical protein